jgi:hypothetical protein
MGKGRPVASERTTREPAVTVREALVGELPDPRRAVVSLRGRWAKPLAAVALVATLAAFAYRLVAPRNHDFTGALDQAERLVADGKLAEAGSLLLGRIAPERLAATPEESLRFETVHQAWLDAVKAAREAKRTPVAEVAQAEVPVLERPEPVEPLVALELEPGLEPGPEPGPEPVADATPPADAAPPVFEVPGGEAILRLAEIDAEAGRHEAARMRFESAISLGLPPGSEANARLGLAETYAALGDHAAARTRYSELAQAAAELDPAFRSLAAGSILDRVDSMLALGEFEAALGYAETAEPLVVAGSPEQASLAVRRASTRLSLANRLVAEGDVEAAKPLARAAAAEFLRADSIEASLGAAPEGFAAGTFARLAGEAMRIVAGEPRDSAPSTDSLAAFLRAEIRRDAGLAASRALLSASSEGRDALVRSRLEAYASALADYESIVAGTAGEPGLRALASSRSVECLVALNRLPEAIARLESLAAASPGSAAALESLERGLELARHARDAASVERLAVAGRTALDATPDAALSAAAVPVGRADWRRVFAPTGLASVPDRP